MKPKITLAAGMMIFSMIIGCEQITEPVRTPIQNYPAPPTHLSAQIGDRSIRLLWSEPSGGAVAYYIYRQDSASAAWLNIDSSTTTTYNDVGLLNGNRYSYSVSARNRDGYRGSLSAPVAARPGLYSMVINDGALFTNSTSLELSFIAPSGTRYVKIGLDSVLASANWQLYSESMRWSLPPGEGQQFVYAIFLDSEANTNWEPVVDDIYLDTRASILSLEVTNGAQPRRIGDLVSFRMRTGEAYGTASVDLGKHLTGIRLYDDGTHGDINPDDGLYGHDYIIPPCNDIANLSIIGYFTDIASNQADPVTILQTLTIENPPRAVTLFNPQPLGGRSDALQLTWSQNEDTDFAHYKLMRGKTSSVDSTAILLRVISQANGNQFVDSLLTENQDYYYRVYVYDQQGLAAASNVVKGHTPANEPPQAAVLQPPLNVTGSSMILTWTQNSEYDFAHYTLHRDTNEDVTSNDEQVVLISSRSTVQYQDTGLLPNKTYWYRLFTVDKAGQKSASNIVSATTIPDERPEAVLLASPAASGSGALRLTWSASRATNFASYRIFRSITQVVDGTGTPIVIISNANTTQHDDVGLASNTIYYYRVFVYDLQGRSTGSNLVYGTTLP